MTVIVLGFDLDLLSDLGFSFVVFLQGLFCVLAGSGGCGLVILGFAPMLLGAKARLGFASQFLQQLSQ